MEGNSDVKIANNKTSTVSSKHIQPTLVATQLSGPTETEIKQNVNKILSSKCSNESATDSEGQQRVKDKQSTVNLRTDFNFKNCPDWLLAQLFYASALDLHRFELICESVKDTIIADGVLNEEEFLTRLDLDEEKFDIDDARACFGAINYIITSACNHTLSIQLLNNQLLQLGLPTDHTGLLCKIIEDNLCGIRDHL